jgi:hypothetical protein
LEESELERLKNHKNYDKTYKKYELIIESGMNIYILMSWLFDHHSFLSEEDHEL